MLFYLILFLNYLLSLVLNLLRRWSPRLWRQVMSWYLARLQQYLSAHPNSRLQQEANFARLMLLYDQGATWQEFYPALLKIDDLRFRSFHTWTVLSFFCDKYRFVEAELAARYWSAITSEWVTQRRNEALEARRLLKQLRSWRLDGEFTGCLSGKPAMEASRKASQLGGALVRAYRNSHLAVLLLERRHTQKFQTAELNHATGLKTRSPLPELIQFDYAFAEKLGIDRTSYTRLLLEAEELY